MNYSISIGVFAIKDLLRNKWTMIFAAFYFLVTIGLLEMVVDSTKVVISLVDVVLFSIPLITLIFGTTYFYGSREFIKFLLAQPIGRPQVLLGLIGGLVLSLSCGFLFGVGIPFLLYNQLATDISSTVLTMGLLGVALIMTFASLSFLISLSFDDKGRGLGAALLIWLALAVIYDGMLLMLANLFSDYPIENALLGAILLNPIDLSRILLIFKLDLSALMGYTGAVFKRFFGEGQGVSIAIVSLLVWSLVPSALSMLKFKSKDF